MSRGRHGINREEYITRSYEFAVRGNGLPHAKLTPELVREIRANRHGMTARQWAERLGVHIRTIDAVREYKTWAHIN